MKHCLLSILNIHDLNFVNDKGIQGLTAGSSALDIRYQYDVRGQLLEECRNGAAVRYAYDAAGNRIQKTENKKETRYRYNQKNQLLQKEDADGISCFTYDRQGGIIEEKNAAGNRRFTYNSLHQQTQVETETGNIQKNRYDAEGLRYELIENSRRTSFVYHNGELLQEKGEEAGLSKEATSYHLGAGIEAFQRNSKTFYYHQDEQLNTTLISDEKAAIRNHYQYDAFGAGLEASEALSNRIRYTGQQYDEQTEQYYLRARYYNPVLGRFMQEDVYQGDGLNLYAYCANNPVVYYDPSGYSNTNVNTSGCAGGGQFGNNSNQSPPTNKKGVAYPKITDVKTGKLMEFPEGDLEIVPKENRVEWYRNQSLANVNRTDPIMCKRDFIEEWYNRGYNTPSGGWELYDIHHIKPRQYGGSNSFDNLTPVQKNTHDTLDTWWKSFGGKNDK